MTVAAKSRRIVFLICAAAVGCGGEQGRVPVAGRVFVNGSPLAEGAITFFSPTTKLAAAAPVKGGAYVLPPADGPAPGAQVVRIVGFRPAAGRAGVLARRSAPSAVLGSAAAIEAADAAPAAMEQFLPARFNTHSELTADVSTAGTDEINFRLSLAP